MGGHALTRRLNFLRNLSSSGPSSSSLEKMDPVSRSVPLNAAAVYCMFSAPSETTLPGPACTSQMIASTTRGAEFTEIRPHNHECNHQANFTNQDCVRKQKAASKHDCCGGTVHHQHSPHARHVTNNLENFSISTSTGLCNYTGYATGDGCKSDL